MNGGRSEPWQDPDRGSGNPPLMRRKAAHHLWQEGRLSFEFEQSHWHPTGTEGLVGGRCATSLTEGLAGSPFEASGRASATAAAESACFLERIAPEAGAARALPDTLTEAANFSVRLTGHRNDISHVGSLLGESGALPPSVGPELPTFKKPFRLRLVDRFPADTVYEARSILRELATSPGQELRPLKADAMENQVQSCRESALLRAANLPGATVG